MTECLSTPVDPESLSGRMWEALDPRKGSPKIGQSVMAKLREIAASEGVPARDLPE